MRLLTRRQTEAAEHRAAGKSRREIAKLLGVTPETIKKYIQRARQRARKRAVTRQQAGTQERCRQALTRNGGKPVRFKPYSLLPTDNV